jgi:hypothetical protein
MSYARQMPDTCPRTFSVDTDLQPSMGGTEPDLLEEVARWQADEAQCLRSSGGE